MKKISTKEKILLAALDLFSEKGYADTEGQKVLREGAV